MYDDARYLTVTGHRIIGTPARIEDREAEIRQLHAEVFGDREQPTREVSTSIQTARVELRAALDDVAGLSDAALADDDLLQKAQRASNGHAFMRLWAGDISYPSQSEADIRLCGILAFWTRKNPAQMDRLFRRSGLMRGKWDELRGTETYGQITIAKAIEGCASVWQPAPSLKEVRTMTTTPPPARPISNFPMLTEITGGLRGLWVIGGVTGSGKSTLAMNIAASVAAVDFPVLYLDMENDTGPVAREVGDRIAAVYGEDAPALANIHAVRDPARLDSMLIEYAPQALIVIDTVQLLLQRLVRGDNQKAAADTVMHRCIEWVGQGYTVVALSQVNRNNYTGRPTLAAFKESGGIEAAATAAMFMWMPKPYALPRLTVPKLRFAPPATEELVLERRGWRLEEVDKLPLPAATRPRLAGAQQDRPQDKPGAPMLSDIQRAVQKLGSPAATGAILKELGLSRRRKTGERRLQAAEEACEIVKVRKGRWALPPGLLPDATAAQDATHDATACRMDVASGVASSGTLIPA
jgi:hypothetical protein